MLITAEKFEERVGCKPEQDDLERCNCDKAGQIGHEQCGWDAKRDMPVFVPGGLYIPIDNTHSKNTCGSPQCYCIHDVIGAFVAGILIGELLMIIFHALSKL